MWPGAKSRGFSLIEVVIALGIISFAIVGIMGLFPVAMKSAQESQRETRATLIARQIFSDLASMPPTNTFIATNSDVLAVQKTVNLRQNSVTVAAYNNDGIPVSTNSPEAIYEATVYINTNSVSPGLSHVRTSVRAIGMPTNTNFSYVFVKLMNANFQ